MYSKYVFGPQKRISSYCRPKTIQQVHKETEIQDGLTSNVSTIDKRRLDVLGEY